MLSPVLKLNVMGFVFLYKSTQIPLKLHMAEFYDVKLGIKQVYITSKEVQGALFDSKFNKTLNGSGLYIAIGRASLVFILRDVTRFTPSLARLVQ